MSLAERISELFDAHGITVYAVEKKLHLSKGRLYKILKDNRPVESDLVESILSIFDLSDEDKYYLYTGSRPAKELSEPGVSDPIDGMVKWMTKVEREMNQLRQRIELLEKR